MGASVSSIGSYGLLCSEHTRRSIPILAIRLILTYAVILSDFLTYAVILAE
jgi:hypothetical protein